MPLSPRAPELNPVKNLWQFLHDNWLSNRIFENYDDILEHCCKAWNNLVDQPDRIPRSSSITSISRKPRSLAWSDKAY